MEEEWKIILDYPDYMISNIGRVFSNRRNKMVKINIDRQGYPCVNLCYNDGLYWARPSVHRLVAFAFVDGYFESAVVNHIDGVKQNSAASNLEWITHGDNVRHAVALGLKPRRIRIVETRDVFLSVASCARYIGGNLDAILRCLNGKQRTHKGYTFEYVRKKIGE